MPTKSFFAAVLLTSLCLQGCAGEYTNADEQISGDAEELVSQAANTGYYVVTRQDLRRCVSPVCGGVFVKRVNSALTTCGDSVRRSECYISTTNLAPLGFTEAQSSAFRDRFNAGHAVVRATMRYSTFAGTRIGQLRVNEAWDAGSDIVSSGAFFRVADSGVRCIRAPCPRQVAYTLNHTASQNIVRFQIDNVGSANDRATAETQAFTATGVIVSGNIALPKCRANTACGPMFIADNFYKRLEKALPGPARCGGLAGLRCAATEYCNYAAGAMCGAADQLGTCTERPAACIDLFDPVCGCDDRTYSNACMAAAAGVSVASTGACNTLGQTCGTRGAVQCAAGQFCAFPIANECGRFDAGGTCEEVPSFCTQHVQPVCGCDGTTYSNECRANAAGFAVSAFGPCL